MNYKIFRHQVIFGSSGMTLTDAADFGIDFSHKAFDRNFSYSIIDEETAILIKLKFRNIKLVSIPESEFEI